MRDFSQERLSNGEGTSFLCRKSDERVCGEAWGEGGEESGAFATQLVARWNACADALAYLERLRYRTNEELTVMVILRRAVHGEG